MRERDHRRILNRQENSSRLASGSSVIVASGRARAGTGTVARPGSDRRRRVIQFRGRSKHEIVKLGYKCYRATPQAFIGSKQRVYQNHA